MICIWFVYTYIHYIYIYMSRGGPHFSTKPTAISPCRGSGVSSAKKETFTTLQEVMRCCKRAPGFVSKNDGSWRSDITVLGWVAYFYILLKTSYLHLKHLLNCWVAIFVRHLSCCKHQSLWRLSSKIFLWCTELGPIYGNSKWSTKIPNHGLPAKHGWSGFLHSMKHRDVN